MRLILVLALFFSVGVQAEEFSHVAATEVSVAQSDVLFAALETAGLEGVPRVELVSRSEDMQPGHSYLLEQDVIFDGAYRTVQFSLQKKDGGQIVLSVLTHSEAFAGQIQSIMNAVPVNSAE